MLSFDGRNLPRNFCKVYSPPVVQTHELPPEMLNQNAFELLLRLNKQIEIRKGSGHAEN